MIEPSHPDSSAWPAPAKLNLMLRILGRRPDGYHRLQTVFQFIDRQDWLWFDVRQDGEIRRLTVLPQIPEREDLTVRAARALQEVTGCRLGVDIRIQKVLPLGGGLGGGSSDAATTLVALNHLWRLGLDRDRLARLGLDLGADVPVFVRGQAAWGEGVGEELTTVALPEPWYLVLVPDCQVSTARIFGHPKLTRNSVAVTLNNFLSGDRTNDCLSVVRSLYPPVAGALDWLSGQGEARLTGTGACCFAECADDRSARAALDRLPSGLDGFIARGLYRSPLLDRLVDARSPAAG